MVSTRYLPALEYETISMSDTKYQGDAATVVNPLDKGLGALEAACTSEQVATQRWNVLNEDLNLPAAVLSHSRLEHNLAWMQRFVGEYGAKLAPHGKTTMAPRLFQRQLAGGAWGITLATAHQTRIAYVHGVRRVLMANQLIGKRNMAILAELLADPSFEFFCLVDAADQVDQLAAFFGKAGPPIQVLIELGELGGRTGVRDDAQLQSVLEALVRAGGAVRLAGVEVYEGELKEAGEIRAFLRRAVKVFGDLAAAGRLQRTPPVLTGAGSAWYDVVAEEFSKADIGQPFDLVLRPGCYLTHDVGIYKAAQAQINVRNPVAPSWRWASAMPPSMPASRCRCSATARAMRRPRPRRRTGKSPA